MAKISCIGWLIGYFVVLAPVHYHFPHGIIWSLIHSIIGLIGAIVILRWNK